jgi:hypothetical protein
LEQVPSPDGKYIAAFFERSCGATTPFYRMVALRFSNQDFRDDAVDNPAFSLEGKPDVKLRWENSRRLILVSYQCDKTSMRHNVWRDVEIACAAPK